MYTGRGRERERDGYGDCVGRRGKAMTKKKYFLYFIFCCCCCSFLHACIGELTPTTTDSNDAVCLGESDATGFSVEGDGLK